MKKYISLALFLILVIVGCQTKAGTGAAVGGGIGATTGGVIGGGSGALVGGAVGALGGGLVGAALDEQDRRILERSSPRTIDRMDRGEPLTVSDVIKLSQAGINDDVIIDYIEDTKTIYRLSQAQVRRMQQGGVSQRVINYMLDTGR